MKYIYCPQCTYKLETNGGEVDRCPAGTQYCPVCDFVHWKNPIPVSAVLVPFKPDWEISTNPTTSVLVVKRKVPPFPGRWCMPCGYMNCNERPKASARREVFEETNVHTRMVRLIALCNPSVSANFELNQLTAFYLGNVNEDNPKPKAGDDAAAVGIYFPRSHKVKNLTTDEWEEREELCFGSHEIIVKDWLKGDIDRMGVNYELKYNKKPASSVISPFRDRVLLLGEYCGSNPHAEGSNPSHPAID